MLCSAPISPVVESHADGDLWDFGLWNTVGRGQLPGGGLVAEVGTVTWRLETTMRHEAKWLLQMTGPLARGKALGIGFCGPIDHVLKTHLDLMMNVKMFLVPFNSDLLGGKSLEMSCRGIPWICSSTREFCGSWPTLRQGGV